MKPGDVESNLQKYLELIEAARKNDVNLISFPEFSLTGYSPQGLTTSFARVPTSDNSYFRQPLDASQGIDILVGSVEDDIRHRFTISSAYLPQEEVLHIHRKVYICQPMDFMMEAGSSPSVTKYVYLTHHPDISICEDFWHTSPVSSLIGWSRGVATGTRLTWKKAA